MVSGVNLSDARDAEIMTCIGSGMFSHLRMHNGHRVHFGTCTYMHLKIKVF